MNLFEDIERCSKADRCWGQLENSCAYGPVVVPCSSKQPKVMIITEQPNLTRPNNTKHWNPSAKMIEHLIKAQKGKRSGIAPKINDMLRGELLSDFDKRHGRFNDFYWTHFIKCPGQLRRKRAFGGGPLIVEACMHSVVWRPCQHVDPIKSWL